MDSIFGEGEFCGCWGWLLLGSRVGGFLGVGWFFLEVLEDLDFLDDLEDLEFLEGLECLELLD